MLAPINLSAYADPVLDALASGEPKFDHIRFFETVRRANGPVLELGCGLGRYTIPLAQEGIDITGLELSTPSLSYAREKAGDLPIRWIEGDARDFHLDQRFALIFAKGCVFNFLLTRADQEAMLACVHAHLSDGGQFMFDTLGIPHADMLVDDKAEVAWFTLVDPQGRTLYVSGTSRFEQEHQRWVQTCYHRLDDADGELIAKPWELTLRYPRLHEVEELLHANGFKIVEQYVGYNGTPASEERPPEVYICEKRSQKG